MKKKLLIKVCGMKDPGNIRDLAGAKPDMMGFIFHPSSPRYAGREKPPAGTETPGILRVGVFVNMGEDDIVYTFRHWKLDLVQLHGDETAAFCRKIHHAGIKLIKAFRLGRPEHLKLTRAYENFCTCFLFDAAGPGYGGHGRKFPWQWLKAYDGDTPFLLSGGIGPGEAPLISGIHHPMLAGVDINSRFETLPGLKNVHQVKKFMENIRKNETHY